MSFPHFESAGAAETAFYRAFEDGDLDAMMAVWADVPGIVCIHPLGRPLTGPESVRASWAQILGDRRLSLSVETIAETASADLVVRVVRERIGIHESGGGQAGTVLASNAYRLLEGGWRMVLHHASPLPDARPPARTGVH